MGEVSGDDVVLAGQDRVDHGIGERRVSAEEHLMGNLANQLARNYIDLDTRPGTDDGIAHSHRPREDEKVVRPSGDVAGE